MAPIANKRVLFNEYPTGFPEPGKTLIVDESEKIDLDTVPLNGGLLVKLLTISIDPYLRGMMNKVASYASSYEIGKPIHALGIVKVLRSESPRFTVGDHLYGNQTFTEYAVYSDEFVKSMYNIENKEKLPWSIYLGVAGMPGRTAYYGYHEFMKAHVKKGDTIFISAGGGAVGSFLIQIAKADGLKVISSAGSAEKIQLMKDCGADITFNYKTTSTEDILKEHGPINFYWDNVGGETLDLAFKYAAQQSHFVECGFITGYNGENAPLKNYSLILWREIKLYGFLIFSYEEKYGEEFIREVPPRVARGEFKFIEDKRQGLDSVGQAMYDVQAGKNKGKTVIEVAEN